MYALRTTLSQWSHFTHVRHTTAKKENYNITRKSDTSFDFRKSFPSFDVFSRSKTCNLLSSDWLILPQGGRCFESVTSYAKGQLKKLLRAESNTCSIIFFPCKKSSPACDKDWKWNIILIVLKPHEYSTPVRICTIFRSTLSWVPTKKASYD